MAGPPISGALTRLQCCPVGEGQAAASWHRRCDCAAWNRSQPRRSRDRIGDADRRVYREAKNFDAELTRETVAQAYRESGIGARDLDVLELHDAFTIEELLYLEAMGLCEPGEARE